MEGKKDLFHWIHALFGLYMMFGGFLPYVWWYNWISAITIFTWILFGRCIASDGYNYKKGSLMEEILGDDGLELFETVLPVGQVTTAIRLRNPTSLVVYTIYKLKELST